MRPRRTWRATPLIGLAAVGAFSAPWIVAACNVGTTASPAPLSVADPDGGAPACLDALPDGGRIRVTGTVTEAHHDAGTPEKGIANAMVAVEYGGLYLPWCNLAHASPYYVYGALTDDAGRFEIDVKEGALGFHSFADDYYYTRAGLDTHDGTTVSLAMEPLPKAQPQPSFANAGFDKRAVGPGEVVTFSATLATEDAKDPLSDENIIVEPTHSWGIELDPPRLGAKDNFADGLWKRSFPAPAEPGTYTYWFSATTSQCVTSRLVAVPLTVR